MMDNDAAVKRTYRAVKRAEAAEATRRRVLDAATALFLRQGYLATTIADIAAEANVASKTVHLGYGTKARLLDAAIRRANAGDDDDEQGVASRPDWQAMLAAPPEEMLAGLAAVAASINRRTADLFALAEIAAATDQELAAFKAQGLQQRIADFSRVAAELRRRRVLATGMSSDLATATILTLTADTTYRLLVNDLGWAPKKYERWLARTMRATLLSIAP